MNRGRIIPLLCRSQRAFQPLVYIQKRPDRMAVPLAIQMLPHQAGRRLIIKKVIYRGALVQKQFTHEINAISLEPACVG